MYIRAEQYEGRSCCNNSIDDTISRKFSAIRLTKSCNITHKQIRRPYCIYRSQPEMMMSSMAGDGDVSYGRR